MRLLDDSSLGGYPPHKHPVTELQTTGTRDGTKFLRDDGAWATPAGGGGGGGSGTLTSVVAGNNIDVDNTDPANPVVSVEVLTAADISDVTATATELNYTDGVTGPIQTQLDGKVGTGDSRLSDSRTPTAGSVTTGSLAAATLVTAAEGLAANNNDTTIPTSAAVKAYTDAVGGGAGGGTVDAIVPGTHISVNSTDPANPVVSLGALTADDIGDGTTYKRYSATEQTKLSGVATGATANDTDANLKNRANHTGTQTSSTISDLTEAVQDIVGAFISGASGVTVNYDDTANTITVSGLGDSSATAETIRDTIGVALLGTGLISVTVNDALDTITISTTATANDTDANLKNRANHTGTQTASTISDFSSAADARISAGSHAATSKTTPVDADELPLVDSAASFGLKKLTWANLKATIKSYYDSATSTLTNKTISGASNTLTNIGSSAIDGSSDVPRFLVFSTSWPARANDNRLTFFIGGSAATNAPTDANLKSYDVWIPATA